MLERFRLLFAVTAAVFAIVAGWLAIRTRRRLARCQRLSGVCLELRPSKDESRLLQPVVRYRSADGSEVTFESEWSATRWKFKAGDVVEVLVDPGKPGAPEVARAIHQYMFPITIAASSFGSALGLILSSWRD